MKKKKRKNWLLLGGIAVLLVAAVLIVNSATNKSAPTNVRRTNQPATSATDSHGHDHSKKRVPAYEVAPTRASLRPTLDPERFTGITRDAYRAVKQIPVTIAQLPCYCHCDEGFGHKSLYTCFEDDHASHCDVCIREALLALALEKDQKLSPAEIRQRIVQHYSQQ